MSDDVNIKISATDNATATLRAVQGQLASFSASIKGFAAGAVAGFGVSQITAFLGDSLKAYGESERAVTMLDRVLKSTGNTIKMTRQQIQEYAEARMAQTTFDDDAIVEAASQLARFRDISGDTFTATLDAAQDLATVMGTDLVSATQMLGRAMSEPADGLAKLARAGVMFTDSQKEQIKTLDLIGDKAGQQKIILEELRRQFGGAAVDDASTASGQIKQLSNTIGELKEAIGEKLTPVVRDLISFIGSQVSPPNPRSAINGLDNAMIGVDFLGRTDFGGMSQDDIQARFNQQSAALRAAREEEVRIRESMDNQSTMMLLLGFRTGPKPEEQQAQLDALQKKIKRGEDQLREIARNINPEALHGDAGVLRIGGLLMGAASGLAGGLGAGFQEQFAGLTQGINIGGMQLPNGAQAMGMSLVNQMLGEWSPFAMGGPRQEEAKQERIMERALSATESRFLTRGRGQLSMAEQKQIENGNRMVNELREIKNSIDEWGSAGVLVVEGIK